MEKEESMSSLENEVFINMIDSFGIVVIIFKICRWRLVVDLSTFRSLITIVIVVVGDVCKFAAETLQFSLCHRAIWKHGHMILGCKLQDAVLTLSKSA